MFLIDNGANEKGRPPLPAGARVRRVLSPDQ